MGKWGVTANGYEVSFQVDENVLELDRVMVAQCYEYATNHLIIKRKEKESKTKFIL